MKGYNKIMVKVQSNRFDLNDIITELSACHYVLNAGFIAEKETIKYELVMFKLETRVLLLNPDLQNLMNKYQVEYMDFGDGHFIVGAFGNREYISNLLGKLIPYGIVEYSRSSVGLLKDDMVLQYCD
jgi:acetolactate synthase-1/3 small subunit